MTNETPIEPFRQTTIKHPHLVRALAGLRRGVRQADKGTTVFLFGPSGVGKTTLLSHFLESVSAECRDADGFDPGEISVAYVEAPAPDAQKFSWKDFYRRLLAGLWEPLPEKKVNQIKAFRYKIGDSLINDARAPGHELRTAVENALRYRNVKVLLIDEAQHIAKGARGGSSLEDQLDYIKSLANLTKTVIVLAGTYELLAFRNLSGQLSRRSIDVHFPRYLAADPDEFKMFATVVASFQKRLPVPCDPDLVGMANYLYAGSVGCVGVLKDWLRKSLELAAEEGSSRLIRRHLEESAYSCAQLDKMADEMIEGERLLKTRKDSMAILQAKLGVPALRIDGTGSNAKTAAKDDVAKKAKRRNKPGTRNPKRDPVGVHRP